MTTEILRPVYREGRLVRILDQRLLPADEVWLSFEKPSEVALAIREMVVRGAPSIGVAAAYGAAFSMRSGASTPPAERFETARRVLGATRPTAVNLFASLDRMHELTGVSVVLPAHGHPFQDLPQRAKDIRRHALSRHQPAC